MNIHSLRSRHGDDLVEIPVTRGPRDPVISVQPGRDHAVRHQRSPSTTCPKQVDARLPDRVSRRERSVNKSLATYSGQVDGHIERGSMGYHGEPLVWTSICGKTSATWGFPPACPWISLQVLLAPPATSLRSSHSSPCNLLLPLRGRLARICAIPPTTIDTGNRMASASRVVKFLFNIKTITIAQEMTSTTVMTVK